MRIGVCDDDEVFRAEVSCYIKPYQDNNKQITVCEFASGEDLVSAYANNRQFDILFLDILMNDLSGVQTAEIIRKTDKNVIIIFITNYSGYVPETFRVGAFQFLMKPVRQGDFAKEFERATELHRINHYKYLVKQKDKTYILEISKINYIESSGRHILVVTENNELDCVGKISDEEKKLAGYNFVKCHQGYLVNAGYIKLIESNKVHLTTGKEIPLSRHFRTRVKTAFGNYILGCTI